MQKILREQGVDQVKAFAHLAAQDKAKARGRGKADGAAIVASAKPASAAPIRAAEAKAPRVADTPVSLEGLIRSALVELESCRACCWASRT